MWSGSVRNVTRRQENNCTTPPRLCMEDLWVIFIAEWITTTSTLVFYGGLASGDWIILEYSGTWSLKAEVTSKRWETVKKFTEVSLGRRRAELYRAWSDRTPTRRGMLFDVVTDKLDLYSAERRLEKEKCNFFVYYIINQCTWCDYKTSTVLETTVCNCAFVVLFY